MQTQKGKQAGVWPVMDPWESCDNAVGRATAAPQETTGTAFLWHNL